MASVRRLHLVPRRDNQVGEPVCGADASKLVRRGEEEPVHSRSGSDRVFPIAITDYDPDKLAGIPDPGESVEVRIQKAEVAGIIKHAVSGLTREHRRILILRYQDDLTFADIAQQLGVTEVSAHQMHSRALARLKQSCAWMGLDSFQKAA